MLGLLLELMRAGVRFHVDMLPVRRRYCAVLFTGNCFVFSLFCFLLLLFLCVFVVEYLHYNGMILPTAALHTLCRAYLVSW